MNVRADAGTPSSCGVMRLRKRKVVLLATFLEQPLNSKNSALCGYSFSLRNRTSGRKN